MPTTPQSDNHHLPRLETNHSKISNFLRCENNVQFAITPSLCLSLSLFHYLSHYVSLPPSYLYSRKRTHPKRLQNSFSTNPCGKRSEVLSGRHNVLAGGGWGGGGRGRVPVGAQVRVDDSLAQHNIFEN